MSWAWLRHGPAEKRTDVLADVIDARISARVGALGLLFPCDVAVFESEAEYLPQVRVRVHDGEGGPIAATVTHALSREAMAYAACLAAGMNELSARVEDAIDLLWNHAWDTATAPYGVRG